VIMMLMLLNMKRKKLISNTLMVMGLIVVVMVIALSFNEVVYQHNIWYDNMTDYEFTRYMFGNMDKMVGDKHKEMLDYSSFESRIMYSKVMKSHGDLPNIYDGVSRQSVKVVNVTNLSDVLSNTKLLTNAVTYLNIKLILTVLLLNIISIVLSICLIKIFKNYIISNRAIKWWAVLIMLAINMLLMWFGKATDIMLVIQMMINIISMHCILYVNKLSVDMRVNVFTIMLLLIGYNLPLASANNIITKLDLTSWLCIVIIYLSFMIILMYKAYGVKEHKVANSKSNGIYDWFINFSTNIL